MSTTSLITYRGDFRFLDAPRRVEERFTDIVLFQVRICRENVRDGPTAGDEADNRANRDAQAADTGLPPITSGSSVILVSGVIAQFRLIVAPYRAPHHG